MTRVKVTILVGILSGLLWSVGGCERSTSPASGETRPPVDDSSIYASQDGVETPYQPETVRLRQVHVLTRHARHRHAGPR
jgi:hypothetical protein